MPRTNHHLMVGLVWQITVVRQSVEGGSSGDIAPRDDRCSESIAVGSDRLVEQVKNEFGFQKHNIARLWWRTICILACRRFDVRTVARSWRALPIKLGP
jgi:hypothetical protein